MQIRKNDSVMVIAGKERGKTGKVLRVLLDKDAVIIERTNMVKRHTKPTQKNPQGGIVDKEGSVHASNVQLFDSKTNRGTRTKTVTEGDKKVRVGVKSGTKFSTAGM